MMINPTNAMPENDRVAFLVGAGRSGTTLLYKLLGLHPQVGYITNYENRSGWFKDGLACRAVAWRLEDKVRAWFKQGGEANGAKPWRLARLFPSPCDGEPVFQSVDLAGCPAPNDVRSALITDGLRRKFDRIRRRAGASILLSRPTGGHLRIPQQDMIFPTARYLHLVRDGRDVARSRSSEPGWPDVLDETQPLLRALGYTE